MDENDILSRIESLCCQNNYSIYRLAKESGVPFSTVFTIFKKRTYPSIPTLVKLCTAFNITISDFFITETLPMKITEEDAIFLNIFHKMNARQKSLLFTYLNGLLLK